MPDTLKDVVVARSSIGRKLDDVSNRTAPNASPAVDRKMMYCINNFLDDIVALGEQAAIPSSRARKTFKKAASAFMATKSAQIDQLVGVYGQQLRSLGATNVEKPLRELAEITTVETLLVRAATSHG